MTNSEIRNKLGVAAGAYSVATTDGVIVKDVSLTDATVVCENGSRATGRTFFLEDWDGAIRSVFRGGTLKFSPAGNLPNNRKNRVALNKAQLA